jgi:hypothetical protein
MKLEKKPQFLKLKSPETQSQTNAELTGYLRNKLGPPPTVSGARRRWNYLKAISEHIYYKKTEDFNSLVRWIAHSCECMRVRTVREDYIEYLALLDILGWNVNSQTVTWKGEA